MSRLQFAQLQLDSITPDGQGAVSIDFRPRRPFRFTAGQHGLWVVPGGGLAPFTMASAPEEEVVTLGTGLASGTRFKRALAGLARGDAVRLLGPLGRFTLDGAAPSVVMLAQGVGVTPFRAMLRHVALAGGGTRATLVHVGATHPFRGDTEAVAARALFPVSREGFARDLAQVHAEQPDATFLVSGSAAFVSSTAGALRERSVDLAQIRRDTFWGYRSRLPAVPVSS